MEAIKSIFGFIQRRQHTLDMLERKFEYVSARISSSPISLSSWAELILAFHCACHNKHRAKNDQADRAVIATYHNIEFEQVFNGKVKRISDEDELVQDIMLICRDSVSASNARTAIYYHGNNTYFVTDRIKEFIENDCKVDIFTLFASIERKMASS